MFLLTMDPLYLRPNWLRNPESFSARTHTHGGYKRGNSACRVFIGHEDVKKLPYRVLANRGDNSGGKIKRAGELPLPAAAVRLRQEDHSLDVSVVILHEAVLLLQLVQFLLQSPLPRTLTFRL